MTVLLGEVTSHGLDRRQVGETHSELERLVVDFEAHRSPAFAADLVSAAVVEGRSDTATEAAEFLLSGKNEVPSAILRLAEHCLSDHFEDKETVDEPSEDLVRGRINQQRRELRSGPRNALGWMDLALDYATLGAKPQALRAAEIALSLAPDDRFVLRSSARLFVHQEDPERAVSILRRSRRSLVDPWVMAADLAVSKAAGKSPSRMRQGTGMLAARNWSEHDLSELASAVGTWELEVGDAQKARAFFKTALLDATENSVAQVNWAANQLSGAELQPNLETPRSFEARAMASYWKGKWHDALRESRRWLADQPFSSRPAILGSFLAVMDSEDYAESARLSRLGLNANPRDPTLVNNLAFALARLGRIAEAEETLREYDPNRATPDDEAVILATRGAIAYRAGEVELGRSHYQRAIDQLIPQRNKLRIVMALTNWAVEEERHGEARARELFDKARSESAGVEDPVVEAMIARYVEPWFGGSTLKLPNET